MNFGDALEAQLASRFGAQPAARVIDSFRAVRTGDSLETGVGTPLHRRATSRVLGLTDEPFLSPADFPWLGALEAHASDIAAELRSNSAATGADALAARGTNVWVSAAREEALDYGPDWRTLVLQDREWDEVNCGFFPLATGLLKGLEVPCVEAFFARQKVGTGIALHTDDSNFILTAHLTLEAESGTAWIEVGGVRKYWEEGEGMVFDTSFFHRTMNESSDVERVVLLIRFWHPELTQVERDALAFIFKTVDNPELVEEEAPVAEVRKEKPSGGGGGVELRDVKGKPLSVVPEGSPVPRGMRRAAKKEKKKNSERPAKKSGGGGFGR